ncbi:ribonuclease PH [Candidatus Sumerlaeota bacterium]|nr:ribonuclease PH [Candidatus Sumerlaeota bacterium]
MGNEIVRVDGRKADQIRPLTIIPNYLQYAEGSVMIELGNTRVLCAATVENKTPPHLKDTGQGWVTAEYSLLPRSTQQRIVRDALRGHISGRSYEIQRLIGRALRSVVDLRVLGERTIILDCDVIQADGGTRTAAITGGFVALALALRHLHEDGKIGKLPIKDYIAATSVGIVEGRAVLDLCYLEDAQADVDMNVVMTGSGEFAEVQGTAEGNTFSEDMMIELLHLARQGIKKIIEYQRQIIEIPLLK